mmetsp:Transcript_23440/g.56592  ORF Transcript_23440/g.56592 Transcript_23440/m.56592 type:complete len:254 (-) Transcript_23440:100-861(-)
METRSEGNGSPGGVDLDISQCLVVVHGNNHIDGLNGTAKGLVEFFSGKLQLKKGAINLVDHQTGLYALRNGLTEDRLGLDAHPINGVNDNEGAISHTKCGRHLGREIDVARGIDEVDQVRVPRDLHVGVFILLIFQQLLRGRLFLLREAGSTLLSIVFEKHGDAGGLDGDTALGLVLTGVGVTGAAGGLGGDNSGLLDEGVGQGGLSVVDVSDDGHGPDVVFQVHDGTHLVYCEVHHLDVLLLILKMVEGSID